MGKTKKWTDAELIDAHSSSRSVAEILRKLGLIPAGGNYEFINYHLDRLNLLRPCPDRAWSRGLTVGPKRPIEEYLIHSNGLGRTNDLRKRLIREGIKQAKCERCGLTEWNDEAIPLELDHVDGDRKNNLLENLRILCPNCHAQTPTYRGKNIKCYGSVRQRLERSVLKTEGWGSESPRTYKPANLCIDCSKPITQRATRCTPCAHIAKIQWPPIAELLERLANSNYSKLGRELGVSDNAIRKHLRNHNA